MDLAGERALAGEPGAAKRLGREIGFGRYRCSTLLARDEYQVIVTEAPPVARDELKAAIRWRVKDQLRCHPDDATLDVLDIPPPPAAQDRQVHQMLVFAAENTLIQARVDRCVALGIPLSVIEVPETAQRNLATAAHRDGSAVALLHLLADAALVTISVRGELYFARWIEIGTRHLAQDAAGRESVVERIVLELQRSFDHFERQYRFVGLGKLLLGPSGEEDGLAGDLAQAIGVEVEPYPFERVFPGLPEALREPAQRARLFHLLGAALREDTKVL